MKYGFVLTDTIGNDYRTIATSLTTAIEKAVSDNDSKEEDIINVKRGNSISPISL